MQKINSINPMILHTLKKVLAVFILQFAFACGGPELPETVVTEIDKLSENIDFNRHVKPILSDKCFLCHGPDKNKIDAGLQLHESKQAYSELVNSPGKYAIKPGNLNKSELVHRIISDDPTLVMPKPESHLTLTDYEKAVLIKWIKEGAKYQDHWAFIKPKSPEVPSLAQSDIALNPIDNFIASELKKNNLSQSEKASKELLLRRLSFDITGLPPTIEELNLYLNDTDVNAYEKQVDRLLNSPHYGEQMALDWMDLSRFADTHGYSVDRYRDMSPWRDWVIKAFNQNMPYDQFVTWQLAGDLLPNPSKDMILATAFNRNHPQNMEGGIVNEEFLVEYSVDRVSTVGQAFMGLTVACARCHDHKFDPVSQKNFYEMTSYFNNINESGQISWNGAMPVPTMLLTSEEQEQTLTYLQGLINETESQIEEVETNEIATNFKKWLKTHDYTSIAKSPVANGLVAYFNMDSKTPKNSLHPYQTGFISGVSTKKNEPVNLSPGKIKQGVLLNGDTWLHLKNTAIFGRNNPFSISLWANIPSNIKDGTIFHKGVGAIFQNWRGYHLKIVNDKLEILMANTAPGNAIIELSKETFPKNEWVHFGLAYNGSSKASGFKLYVNGKEMETEVEVDDLYKDILFNTKEEPGLQFGGRMRGKGIKGAVIDEVKVYNKELSTIEFMQLAENPKLSKILTKSIPSLTAKDQLLLKSYYLKSINKKTAKLYHKLSKIKKPYVDSIEKIQEVMVMKETKKPKQAYFLERGAYSAPTEKVYPNVPETILPMPKEFPQNRLGFAQWLFHDDHPLTARVAVNRIWQHYFGIGLVKTSEDFGNQGEMPSHPELLDWLTIEFKKSNWDMKALQKMIVMSHTYQQNSGGSKELISEDKENRLLARGPSKRLTGEMLRDNALACAELLSKKVGGESVKPYQPEGLWKVNNAKYNVSKGDDLYRRSMYTVWKRSVPHPTIATFDVPTRSVCISRRQETNTPLQALVLLNDPTYIEAARVLGKKMTTYSNPKESISTVYRQLTGKIIKPSELNLLIDLQENEFEKFSKNPSKTNGWINTGAFKIDTKDNVAIIAANAVVASTIMNSDATITKR